MKNNIIKISLTLVSLFYFIYIINMLLKLETSNDVLWLVLFDPDKFEYKSFTYILYTTPFFFFIGYGYLLHINELENGIISFHKYRAKSSMEIFIINLKNCFIGILFQTILLLLIMYLFSIIFKIPIVFNHETIPLCLAVLYVVASQYLFLLLNLTYNLMKGIVAILTIVGIIIIVSVLRINLVCLVILELIILSGVLITGRGIFSDRA